MDFDNSATKLIPQEFLAVVLAGFGNELLPLTGNYGDEPSPKALLPVANKPMVEYPLVWIEQSGIKDVLLICPAPHRSALSNYIQSDSSSAFPSLRIDLQTFDETQDLSVGTCTILRHFAHRILRDFVLLPCDFVPPPSFSLTQILNKFRAETTHDGAVATACFFQARRIEKSTDEWGLLPSAVPIVWDDRTGTLLHIETPDNIDRNGEEIELRMSLLSRYPRARLSANLHDSHVYVCKRQVLDALQHKPQFDSIREEFIPWLCKPHYQRTKQQKYGHVLGSITNALDQALALKHSTLHTSTPNHHPYEGELLHTPPSDGQNEYHSRSLVPSPTEDEDEGSGPASLRVGLVVQRSDLGFAARANNLHAYLELNRHFLSQASYSLPTDPESRVLIDHKAQISSDSIIGHSTRVEERTSVKKSVIGKHCIIGKGVKIVGSIVHDHCVVGEGAKLDGCVLGKGTKVGEKAELTRCVTQCGYEVGAGESARNEKLDIADWAAMSQSNSEDTDDGNSSEDSG